MLEREGYRADVVANGREALAALERQAYDVVLLDVQMPEMDGLEAARHIRDTWGAAPHLIALTANALPSDRDACLAAGMDDHVAKPVKRPALRAALERAQERGF
jgi:CheY-like chemotaxis protein